MSDWVIITTVAIIAVYKITEQIITAWTDKPERESDTYSTTERAELDDEDWEDRRIGFKA